MVQREKQHIVKKEKKKKFRSEYREVIKCNYLLFSNFVTVKSCWETERQLYMHSVY